MGALPADKYEVLAVAGKQLWTIGRSTRRLEIWSSNGKSWRNEGTVPGNLGNINQILWNSNQLTLVASTGIYEGDAEGTNWKRIDSPKSEILSLAIKDGRFLAGTSSGLWSKTLRSDWVRVESQGTLPTVSRVRIFGSRLYACTAGGLQESDNFGEQWSDSGDLGVADVRDVVSLDNNDYAATAKGLFQRSNDSHPWKPTGPSRPFTQLEFTDRLWLATDSGDPMAQVPPAMSVSTDRGVNWLPIAPPSKAQIVQHVTSVDGVIFASTDAGVFRMSEPGHNWISAQANLPHFFATALQGHGKQLLAGGDDKLFSLQLGKPEADWSFVGPPISPAFSQLAVFDLYAEKSPAQLLMAGTAFGLFWRGSSNTFTNALSPPNITPRFSNVLSIAEIPAGKSSQTLRFLGTEQGVWFLADNIPRLDGPLAPWNQVIDLYSRYSNQPWFWIITTVGGLASTYLLAMSGLLCAYWLGSNVFVDRSWLVSLADKPLQVVPRLGRWALFIGYSRRLRTAVPMIPEASKSYFGLTAQLPTGSISRPDTTGDILHHHLAATLVESRCIILTGKAGSGKTTVLARLASLALEPKLPGAANLKLLKAAKGSFSKGINGMLPVFVSAGHYSGDLLQAISATLRKRDGIPVDDKGQTIRAQMASGGMLILFDGYSEIGGDKATALKEMIESASDPDFHLCRFIFGGRPMSRFPAKTPVFELQPLELDTVRDVYLPCFGLSFEQQDRILEQLRVFSSRPIDPLLLTMAIANSSGSNPSKTYSALFERYFRRLLKIEPEQNDVWEGWKYCLETFADWFLLSAGARGVGMAHRPLLDAIAGPLFAQLKRYYRFAAKDELEILETLASASLLRRDTNWKFAHDAYEEYFAASRIRSSLTTPQQCPISDKWLTRTQELDEVFSYLRELLSDEERIVIECSCWADPWKSAITRLL